MFFDSSDDGIDRLGFDKGSSGVLNQDCFRVYRGGVARDGRAFQSSCAASHDKQGSLGNFADGATRDAADDRPSDECANAVGAVNLTAIRELLATMLDIWSWTSRTNPSRHAIEPERTRVRPDAADCVGRHRIARFDPHLGLPAAPEAGRLAAPAGPSSRQLFGGAE